MVTEYVISISDNGIGIEKQYQPNVFNMFYRASDKSKGSGLGLYIVKETIQKMNGAITLVSEFAKGSEFRHKRAEEDVKYLTVQILLPA